MWGPKLSQEEKEALKRENSLQIFRCHPDAKLPTRATKESAGIDIYALEETRLDAFWEPTLVRTGLIIRPPGGFYTELVLRSNLAMKGVILANSIGIIDRDYAGPKDELKVMLRWLPRCYLNKGGQIEIPSSSHDNFKIQAGHRIAQLLIRKTESIPILEVDSPPLKESRHGFGSTGV